VKLTVFPHFQPAYEVKAEEEMSAHGGGDVRLLDDVFKPGQPDPLGRAANHDDGARSILTGIAANVSMATGEPVHVDDLVRLP
jgi:hypothetical protein